MNAQYRLVHFLPDPFSGARVPVAALIGTEQGAVAVARASCLPGAGFLGSGRTEAAIEYILESLTEARTLDALPMAVGPQATLGPVTDVPAGVADPAEWLRQHILPRARASEVLVERRVQGHPRRTKGFLFFKRWGVDPLVHKLFRPQQELGKLISKPDPGLEVVSHWTGSPRSKLLLMEPIMPAREQHLNDVREVFGRFAGYRVFFSDAPDELKSRTEFCVYILTGGSAEARKATRAAFETLHARIVDTEVDRERDELLDSIRAIGSGGQAVLATPSGSN